MGTVVGCTGTRDGMTDRQMRKVASVLGDVGVPFDAHHGDCVGADSQFHDMCRAVSDAVRIVVHPPSDPRFRAWRHGDVIVPECTYLVRNRAIVDAATLLIAAPKTTAETVRSGTWSTVRYALATGVPVVVVSPTGEVVDVT